MRVKGDTERQKECNELAYNIELIDKSTATDAEHDKSNTMKTGREHMHCTWAGNAYVWQ